MSILFLFVDTIVFFLGVFLSFFIRKGTSSYGPFLESITYFIIIFMFTSFVLWIFDLYNIKFISKKGVSRRSLYFAFFISLVFSVSFLYFIVPFFQSQSPKTILLLSFIIYFVYVYVSRIIFHKWLLPAKQNVIIFGNSSTIDEILKEPLFQRTYNLISHEDKPDKKKNYVNDELDLVIIAADFFKGDFSGIDKFTEEIVMKGVFVDTDFNLYENIFGRAAKESIAYGMWVLRGWGSQWKSKSYLAIKRIFDLVAAFIALPFAIVIGGVIYVLIWIFDRENPIFIQQRVGYLERNICLYKFRTMKHIGKRHKITKIGRILRRFRLDEIPQIINILSGTISLVGPRPIWQKDYETINKFIPNHKVRTIVKPGIAGWAQLNYKAPPDYYRKAAYDKEKLSADDFKEAYIRFCYDVWYIRNNSIFLDFSIIAKTLRRILL